MALSSFDSWRDMQEGFGDALQGFSGGRADGPKSSGAGMSGAPTNKGFLRQQELASTIKANLSGLDSKLLNKAMPIVMDLANQNNKVLSAQFVAKIIGALGLEMSDVTEQKSKMAQTAAKVDNLRIASLERAKSRQM